MTGGTVLIIMGLYLSVMVLLIASIWNLFERAGQAGFTSIIPFYGTYIWVKIAGRSTGSFLLLFLPIINIVLLFMISLDFLTKFKQPKWHIIPMILFSFVYFPYLAFIIKPEYNK